MCRLPLLKNFLKMAVLLVDKNHIHGRHRSYGRDVVRLTFALSFVQKHLFAAIPTKKQKTNFILIAVYFLMNLIFFFKKLLLFKIKFQKIFRA